MLRTRVVVSIRSSKIRCPIFIIHSMHRRTTHRVSSESLPPVCEKVTAMLSSINIGTTRLWILILGRITFLVELSVVFDYSFILFAYSWLRLYVSCLARFLFICVLWLRTTEFLLLFRRLRLALVLQL